MQNRTLLCPLGRPPPPALALDCIGLWIDCNWLESFAHLSLSLVVMIRRTFHTFYGNKKPEAKLGAFPFKKITTFIQPLSRSDLQFMLFAADIMFWAIKFANFICVLLFYSCFCICAFILCGFLYLCIYYMPVSEFVDLLFVCFLYFSIIVCVVL